MLSISKVQTSIGLVYSFVDTSWVPMMRISIFFMRTRVRVREGSFFFSIPFGSIYYARTFILRQNCPSINMVLNGVDLNNNSGIRRFSHLDILINI